MHMTLDYRIVGPGMFMTATSYGLGRYAYGLFIPTFRDAFSLTDTRLALIASFSYGSYFLVTLIGIYISSRLDPRHFYSRDNFKLNRTVALAEWRQLLSA